MGMSLTLVGFCSMQNCKIRDDRHCLLLPAYHHVSIAQFLINPNKDLMALMAFSLMNDSS
jgi:hypothetical protein